MKAAIQTECDRQTATIKNVWFLPSPFMDLLRDAKKYNNFGLHGCGIASAADALAAVKEYVFDKKSVTPERLFAALDTDWQNDPELLHLLRYEAPKMGRNAALVAFIGDDSWEQLPNNVLAPAKYKSVGRAWKL